MGLSIWLRGYELMVWFLPVRLYPEHFSLDGKTKAYRGVFLEELCEKSNEKDYHTGWITIRVRCVLECFLVRKRGPNYSLPFFLKRFFLPLQPIFRVFSSKNSSPLETGAWTWRGLAGKEKI